MLSIFQRYKLKANHNLFRIFLWLRNVVINISKIQIESKSQHAVEEGTGRKSCYQYFKDTNWKQITTKPLPVLFSWSCYQYFKDTNWKQITHFVSHILCDNIICIIFASWKKNLTLFWFQDTEAQSIFATENPKLLSSKKISITI